MCHAEGKDALAVCVGVYAHIAFVRNIKIDFVPNGCRSAARVALYRIDKIAVALRRVGKSGNRFMQRRCRKIGEKILKCAERISGVVKIGFALRGVYTQRVFDKTIRPPARAFFASGIESALFIFNKGHRFSRCVSSVFNNFFCKERSNAPDIVHERVNVFEYVGIDTLYDITVFFSAVVIGCKKSVVYVAASEADARAADSGKRIG